MLAVPCVEIDPDDWILTGKTLQKLRGKGLSIPLTNVLIATVAMSALLHNYCPQ